MLRVRPVKSSDYKQLLRLAETAEIGMSSLALQGLHLKEKIAEAHRAFALQTSNSHRQTLLWVLEDSDAKLIVGCAAIKPRVGGELPFYTLERVIKCTSSKALNVVYNDTWLCARSYFKPASELVSLYIHPRYRNHQLALLLSYTRLLHIACFREHFENSVIAEVRGIVSETGISPFWEAVGRHFFHMDFDVADALCAQEGTAFIADLMPKAPILISLLPPNAQAVMGIAHAHSQGAKKLLQKQGMQETAYMDMFDAGPLISAKTDTLEIVKAAKTYSLQIGQTNHDAGHWLIRGAAVDAITLLTCAKYVADTGQLIISQTDAKCLKLNSQDVIWGVAIS